MWREWRHTGKCASHWWNRNNTCRPVHLWIRLTTGTGCKSIPARSTEPLQPASQVLGTVDRPVQNKGGRRGACAASWRISHHGNYTGSGDTRYACANTLTHSHTDTYAVFSAGKLTRHAAHLCAWLGVQMEGEGICLCTQKQTKIVWAIRATNSTPCKDVG